MRLLAQEISIARQHAQAEPSTLVSTEDMNRMCSTFSRIPPIVETMRLTNATNRLRWASHAIYQTRPTYSILDSELTALIQAIEDDIRNQHFYHYPADKADALKMAPRTWALHLRGVAQVEDASDLRQVPAQSPRQLGPADALFAHRLAERGFRHAQRRERHYDLVGLGRR